MLIGCASQPRPANPPASEAPAQRSAASGAQEDPIAEAVARALPSEEDLNLARTSVRSTAEWLARGVDSWFGDKPFEEGGSVTDGRLSVDVFRRQDQGVQANVRFNARFHLPNVEKQTYLFIGRDDRRDVVTNRPADFSRRQPLLANAAADPTFFAGLGKWLTDSIDFRIGFRGGLKPYVQGRYRRPWVLGPADLVEFRETLFWSVDDHLGSTTALSYEHAFSSTLAGRWLNAATLTQVSGKFEWHSSLGVYKSFGNQRLLSLEALASGRQGADVAVSDYGLQTRWEQPVHKDWLLGELIVGHFWPRADATSARARAWALGCALKMRF
jgi:hypothetical protein